MTMDVTAFTADRPALEDPRVLALAAARQQISHEGVHNPTWNELTTREQEGGLLDAWNYLHAAIRAGLAPAATPPTDKHMAVWVDDEGLLYADYPTVPAGDDVLRVVWVNDEAVSRSELETEHGATFTRIGWCK
jgi:hypothetical protein